VARDVPLATTVRDGTAFVEASDDAVGERVVYRLEAVEGATVRVLWSESVSPVPPARGLAIASVYPNPGAGPVSVVIDSEAPAQAAVSLYNVAGQLVLSRRAALPAGRHTVVLDDAGRLGSGVYFLRVAARGYTARGKLHILR
jgi:hypothetical protein